MFYRRHWLNTLYWVQRHTRGYDDDAVGNPDRAIAVYALPILKKYRRNLHGYPNNDPDGDAMTFEDWEQMVDEMIFGLDYVVRDPDEASEEERKRVQRGLELFGKHFQSLWD